MIVLQICPGSAGFEGDKMKRGKKVFAIFISVACILFLFTGCMSIRVRKQNKEALDRLNGRYNDTFTYIGYYEDFPRADYVYQFESAAYPGYIVEVTYEKDPYSGGLVYDVADNYQEIRYDADMIALVEGAVKKTFPNEKYGLLQHELAATDYPVCATLDEYMDYCSDDLNLVVYYDVNAKGALSEEEIVEMLEAEIPDGKGRIWLNVYLETNEPNPDRLSYHEMRDYVIHERYDKWLTVNR